MGLEIDLETMRFRSFLFPLLAIGVIESEADPGGLALISAKALSTTDRFIVETLDGPSPARIKSV